MTRAMTVVMVGTAALMLGAGKAIAADRGGHGGHGGGWGGRGGDHTRVSFGLGVSSYGSGFSIGIGNRFGCGPSYCAPVRSYCAPTYCAPRVVVRAYDDCWPRPVYYAPAPVVVTRPVVVERQVIVQSVPAPETAQVIVQQAAPQQAVAQAAVYTTEVRQEPARAQESAPSYRDRELGDAYLRMGDPDNAVRVYSKYLSAWNSDGTAVRNIGFAQIARGDAAEGVRSVARGYQLEPSMASRPLSKADIGGESAYQKTLDNATRAASGSNTSEAWLTVAILQQVGGQREQAVASLQRSRDAGLDKALLDQFTLELSK